MNLQKNMVGRVQPHQLVGNEYTYDSQLFNWKCEEGHEFKKSCRCIRKTGIFCNGTQNLNPRPWNLHTIEDMHNLAKTYNGTCMSTEYINNTYPLMWKCIKGHIFSKYARDIAREKIFCGFCKRLAREKYSIEYVRKLAETKGGRCESTKYENLKSPLLWTCDKGHVFTKSLQSIFSTKAFCNVCDKNNNYNKEIEYDGLLYWDVLKKRQI